MAGTSYAANPRLPATRDRAASSGHRSDCTRTGTEPKRSPEEEARNILATAAKNQPEDGPNTRRAAIRACKYLRAMVNQYESTIHAVHLTARTQTQKARAQ